MELVQAAVLGLVQGLSEFLPISSSGHLIIVPYILHWENFQNNLLFDIALHLGTVLALLVFFWKDWWRLFSAFLNQILSTERKIIKDKNSKLFLILVVGSIPAAFFGLAFQDFVEKTVRQPVVVGVMLIIFALVLKLAENRGKQTRELDQLRFRDGLIVGTWQALSLIPGVSRSGSTITGGLFQGLNRETAVRFSFLLATPAIVGVGILKLKELVKIGLNGQSEIFLVGFLVSAISGYLVIKFLLDYIKRHDFDLFVKYRLIVGIVVILLTLFKY